MLKARKRVVTLLTVLGLVLTTLVVPVPVSAAPVIDGGMSIKDAIGDILDKLFTLAQYIGGGVLIYALITFGLSIAQENPDQRSRAVIYLVAGAMLVGIKMVLKTIGLISY